MATTTPPVNLAELARVAFSNEAAAVELMTRLRWPSGPACPRCGGADPYKLTPKAQPGRPARKGLYKCRACREQFSVTTGTVFEASHLPLSKWLMAIHLMSASKKGLSAHQLHRMLGVTYKAAWFVMHRLRYAMASNAGIFAKLTGVVEADETYIGGRRRVGPTNKEDRAKLATGRPGPKDKKLTPVVALVERQGRIAMFPVERVNGATIQTEIRQRVAQDAHMMTDELHAYDGLSYGFASHQTIKHSAGKYVDGDVHTNTVEGAFSLLKRGIVGVFHHVSRGHLHRYCDEFAFRYNTRTALGYSDAGRTAKLVLAAEGKRLTYKSRSGASAA
jgi:transposase-like protein